MQLLTGTGLLTGGGQGDAFIGGAGASTMPGGSAVISNFVQGQDALRLQGYDLTRVLANDITQSGGNTWINLGNGTTIELKGFTGTLHSTDFK